MINTHQYSYLVNSILKMISICALLHIHFIKCKSLLCFWGFFFSIEMIPNQLFINLTDLIFVDLSNNNLGIVK